MQDILQEILKDSDYTLNIFDEKEIEDFKSKIFTKEYRGQDRPYIKCLIRNRDIMLKPEEVVRQLYTAKLINEYKYPKKRIAFEHTIQLVFPEKWCKQN